MSKSKGKEAKKKMDKTAPSKTPKEKKAAKAEKKNLKPTDVIGLLLS